MAKLAEKTFASRAVALSLFRKPAKAPPFKKPTDATSKFMFRPSLEVGAYFFEGPDSFVNSDAETDLIVAEFSDDDSAEALVEKALLPPRDISEIKGTVARRLAESLAGRDEAKLVVWLDAASRLRVPSAIESIHYVLASAKRKTWKPRTLVAAVDAARAVAFGTPDAQSTATLLREKADAFLKISPPAGARGLMGAVLLGGQDNWTAFCSRASRWPAVRLEPTIGVILKQLARESPKQRLQHRDSKQLRDLAVERATALRDLPDATFAAVGFLEMATLLHFGKSSDMVSLLLGFPTSGPVNRRGGARSARILASESTESLKKLAATEAGLSLLADALSVSE